ncbi:MAG: hypothetical protein ACO1OK_03500 [Devosia sp.]
MLYTLGDETNGEPNYDITGQEAHFSFLVPIEAVGEEIVLFDVNWPEGRLSAYAALKGTLERAENGTIGIKAIGFAYPITALQRDGNICALVQVAYDQNVAIGLQMTSGGEVVGSFTFEKGVYDPNSTEQAFGGEAAMTVYQSLMTDAPFEAQLMSGGVAYSTIRVDAPAFKTFVFETLMPEMDRMKQMDETAPCDVALEDIVFDDPDIDCFLTSACCAVVGLPDSCWELQSLRRLRDGWMSGFEQGRADIARYYAEAPAVAQRLMASPEGRRQLLGLYWRVIVPAATLSRLGCNGLAYRLYRAMMRQLLPA